ncbi:hypothetical protein BV25DRAFT_1819862 [Artomyces pyxidatus]|uniref:Uncharacterized protein n=1 Tax=Artomyces pyxidatus TaxID=48021 RepID=A0ACB8TGI1_9AGAM|nr:hypothetical protein BV25DRAFT_1819862 [Artomyces pyxidatus]
MTPPGTTMKTIQKRLYTVLPRAVPTRVRSNSGGTRSLYTSYSPPLAFFDSPPPPSSRPNSHLLSTTRLPIEAKAEPEAPNNGHPQNTGPAPPSSIALTSPQSSSQSTSNGSLNATLLPPAFFSYPTHPPTPLDTHLSTPAASTSTGKLRYHFDVGAYGIPKRNPTGAVAGRDGHGSASSWVPASRDVDGLDLAVQVGEDAYFVRENAMGVADGVGGWSRSTPKGAHSSSALFARRLMHFCSAEVAQHYSCTSTPAFSFHEPYAPFIPPPPPAPTLASVEEEEDDVLDELEEGLDVLMILERAYERALSAHVVPPRATSPSVASAPAPTLKSQQRPPERLMTGSSTALLAVLDSQAPASEAKPAVEAHDAVIKIAHLGDCMGMLVRDDEIVWRSEEMWWSFNTPLQLGPSSHTSPSSAQVHTLPVRKDDILILASDGLSDNLWDEDVLDEVSRLRKAFRMSKQGNDFGGPMGTVRRRTMAGMLSEALCSRARGIAVRKGKRSTELTTPGPHSEDMDEVPFGRRAREEGREFSGGKADDISVLVAVISPAEDGARR